VVTPDYRLIPEANGGDIIDDVNDFWTWTHTSLTS
jgi:acetyl esterase/lipase